MGIQKNFKITNGLEVNNNLIFADTDSNKVCIATTIVNYNLHVNGGIGATDVIVTGISTFNNLVLDGYLEVDGSKGENDGLLISTGTGVSWSSLSRLIQNSGINNLSLTGYLKVNNEKGNNKDVLSSTGIGITWNSIPKLLEGENLNSIGIITTNTLHVGLGGTTLLADTFIDKVGIGQTQPQQKLDVGGSVKIDENIYDSVNSSGKNGYMLSRDEQSLRWIPITSDIIAGTPPLSPGIGTEGIYVLDNGIPLS